MDEYDDDINDLNLVLLEGVVKNGSVDLQEISENNSCLNFILEVGKTSNGVRKFFPHRIVVFQRLAELYKGRIVDGAFVRLRGHMISSTKSLGGDDAIVFDYSKIVGDFLEVSD